MNGASRIVIQNQTSASKALVATGTWVAGAQFLVEWIRHADAAWVWAASSDKYAVIILTAVMAHVWRSWGHLSQSVLKRSAIAPWRKSDKQMKEVIGDVT